MIHIEDRLIAESRILECAADDKGRYHIKLDDGELITSHCEPLREVTTPSAPGLELWLPFEDTDGTVTWDRHALTGFLNHVGLISGLCWQSMPLAPMISDTWPDLKRAVLVDTERRLAKALGEIDGMADSCLLAVLATALGKASVRLVDGDADAWAGARVKAAG